jgi:hypothetical protein
MARFILEPNDAIRLLIFTRTVDFAPFNPEIGLRKTGKLDPSLDPNFSGLFRPISENACRS